MTQRIPVQNGNRPTNRKRKQRKKWYMTRKEKITLTCLATVTIILLIAAGVMIFNMFNFTEDDGRILKGVEAAGVKLGGMTKEEAAVALEAAVGDKYSSRIMTIDVLGTKIRLTPANTGASMDFASVAEAAYNYGRTGSRSEREQQKNAALTNPVSIPLVDHLNLDFDYIWEQINELGAQFSTSLTEPTFELHGERPNLPVAHPNPSKIYQTLEITLGTPEYELDLSKLYNQVLESYNQGIFEVEGVCQVREPNSWEAELEVYYKDLCVEPVDAQINPLTSQVIPEVYGYGFDLEEIKTILSGLPAGSKYVVELRDREPNVTQELINSNRFKDVLGKYEIPLGTDLAWNTNVITAAQALNGLFLKAGDTFSFNDLLGVLNEDNGYVEAMALHGRVNAMTMGGGITQVSSALYVAVLAAELEITEWHRHPYAPTFTQAGLDAYVDAGKDFCFRNNYSTPIRINAVVEYNVLRITIEGTATRNYRSEITVKVTQTIAPDVLYNVMLPDNPGGYLNDDVLDPGQEGCVVEIYRAIYDKNGTLQNESFMTTYSYEAREAVVVRIQN